MRKQLSLRAAKQAGFTLIELIIVIVIIGILAAVAIPKFTSLSSDATKAKNTATLGAARSAWASAYAIAKGAPTIDQVQAQISPTCTVTGAAATCNGLELTFTATTVGGASVVVAPSDITCKNGTTDCL